MSKYPKEVEETIRAAEEAAKEMFPSDTATPPSDGSTGEVTAPDEGKTQPEPPKAAEPTDQQKIPDTQTPPVQTSQDGGVWEERYRTLKGKYDKEVPRLYSDLQYIKGQLDLLKEENAGLKDRLSATPPPPASDGPDKDTDEGDALAIVKEQFPAIYEAIKQVEKKVTPPSKTQEDSELKQKVEVLERSVSKRNLTDFYTYLDDSVPTWRAVNDDENFLTWLQGRQPGSRQSRHEVLMDAFNSMDSLRVSEVFEDYISRQQQSAPPSTPAQTPPAADPRLKYVAPNKSPKTPASQGGSNKPTYTLADYQKFYNDWAHKKLIMTPEQIQAKKAELDQAMNEGRIVG